MRILDVDVENVLSQLSEEKLNELEQELNSIGAFSGGIFSGRLKNIINDICGQEIGDIINDESAEKAVKDKEELENIYRYKEGMFPGTGIRNISGTRLKELVDREKILTGNYNNEVKRNFINIAKREAGKYVNAIPSDEFKRKKDLFERMINDSNCQMGKINRNIFGTLDAEALEMWGVLPVDIAQAFEEREKNMKSIPNKIKNMANRIFSAPKLAKAFIKEKMVALKKLEAKQSISEILNQRGATIEEPKVDRLNHELEQLKRAPGQQAYNAFGRRSFEDTMKEIGRYGGEEK